MTYQLWTPEEDTQLKDLVSTGKYSYRQIDKIMGGRSLASVIGHARAIDLSNGEYKPRKYEHDRAFFTEPNIVNSYIAGFLAADGSIRQDKAGHWCLRLELSALDRDHLLWIRDSMKHEGPLHSWGNINTFFWQMHVTDSYAKDLERNFGVIWRKTHRLQPPNLPTFDLQFAYLLGLLDGDGCVHISKINNLGVSYVSSSLAAVQWCQMMITHLDFPLVRKKTPLPKELKNVNAYGLAYVGARAVCLVRLAQAFAAQHNLPILARKWNNPRLNQYVADYQQRFPQLVYDPLDHLSRLKSSHSSVSSITSCV